MVFATKVNSQNYRYWSTENQHLFLLTNTQYRGSVNVWAGILGSYHWAIFYSKPINGNHLNLLEESVVPDIYDSGIDEIWFQHFVRDY